MDRIFLADTMLGRLAKWLRIMGYDTHYQSYYGEGVISRLVNDGRLLLSRSRSLIDRYPDSLWIRSDHLNDQLKDMKDEGYLIHDRSKWFSRCLNCNVELENIDLKKSAEKVPEYVRYQHDVVINFCPSCNRYFWKGSHRERMINQLEEWGYG
jgi:uncharacterized protein with PIN domain